MFNMRILENVAQVRRNLLIVERKRASTEDVLSDRDFNLGIVRVKDRDPRYTGLELVGPGGSFSGSTPPLRSNRAMSSSADDVETGPAT